MTAEFSVTRRIELDLPLDELRALVSTPDGWRAWLADDVAVTLAPGGRGSVVAEGERRSVLVREVEPDRLVFDWWRDDDDEAVPSTVTIRLDDRGDVPALEIHEALASADPTAAEAWDVRIALLWIRAALGHPSSVGR